MYTGSPNHTGKSRVFHLFVVIVWQHVVLASPKTCSGSQSGISFRHVLTKLHWSQAELGPRTEKPPENQGELPFCKLLIWYGAFLPPFCSHRRHLCSVLWQQRRRWERALTPRCVWFCIITGTITMIILFWSALTPLWNKTSCKYLTTVVEPWSSHLSGTSTPFWLTAFFWQP